MNEVACLYADTIKGKWLKSIREREYDMGNTVRTDGRWEIRLALSSEECPYFCCAADPQGRDYPETEEYDLS